MKTEGHSTGELNSSFNLVSFSKDKEEGSFSSKGPIPMIIDTDLAFGSANADIDDALAILLALAHPERFNVLAVTAVSGNVDAVRASANIDLFLNRLGFGHVPHCASGTRPWDDRFWVKTRWDRQEQSTLEKEKATQLKYQMDGKACDLMRDVLRSSQEPVTLVCIGPLTNLALVLSIEPELSSKIGLVACMGGAHLVPGVANGPAEFNILADPEAASFVFNTGINIVLFPLDVTKKQAIIPDDLEKWKSTRSSFLSDLADAAIAYMYHRSEMYHQEEPYMFFHDAMPVIWLLEQKYFEIHPCQISIDCSGEFTRGMTIVDTQVRNGRKLDHRMAFDADAKFILDFVLRDLVDCYRGIE